VNLSLEKMSCRALGAVSLVLLAVLMVMFSTDGSQVAWAVEVPPYFTVNEVERVDFSRSDTEDLPLFPDMPGDREKIERLVKLYNRARVSLGEEVSLYEDDPNVMPFFLKRVTFTLADGDRLTMILHNGVSFYTDTPDRAWEVTSPEVSKELEELALSYFVPAQGVKINSRQFRMGEQVTVGSDSAREEEATILLMPSYWPVTIPSAPAPYPVPEAILIATVPVEHDRFSYTFTLEEEMGQTLDGSPGKIGPGAWSLVVVSGGQTMLPITILPAGQQEPRAVVYDRGRVFTWSKTKGVTAGVPVHHADQPLLVSEAKWGRPVTHVSLNFLKDWLDIPVIEVEPGRYRLGTPELGLTVTAGEDTARVSGTMISLEGTLCKKGATWQLPWSSLGNFFGYRVQWLGPETVAFLRELDQLPADVNAALETSTPAAGLGKAVTVTLSGQELDLGTQKAYLDPIRGRVIVPLRATIEALGGKVSWFPLKPEYAQIAAGHNYGLPPTGESINAYVDSVLGSNLWRVYLTPASEGNIVVSLRQLAVALGYQLSWDGSLGRVDLHDGN